MILLLEDEEERETLGSPKAGIVVNLDSHRVDQKFEWRANVIEPVSVIINELESFHARAFLFSLSARLSSRLR